MKIETGRLDGLCRDPKLAGVDVTGVDRLDQELAGEHARRVVAQVGEVESFGQALMMPPRRLPAEGFQLVTIRGALTPPDVTGSGDGPNW